MSVKEAVESARNIGVNFKNRDYTLDDLMRGAIVEAEHGQQRDVGGISLNVAHGDASTYPRIALAHLEERGDYYDGLEIVEKAPKGFWRGKSIEDVIGCSRDEIVGIAKVIKLAILTIIAILATALLLVDSHEHMQIIVVLIVCLSFFELVSQYYCVM